jgi:hypothetical protein
MISAILTHPPNPSKEPICYCCFVLGIVGDKNRGHHATAPPSQQQDPQRAIDDDINAHDHPKIRSAITKSAMVFRLGYIVLFFFCYKGAHRYHIHVAVSALRKMERPATSRVHHKDLHKPWHLSQRLCCRKRGRWSPLRLTQAMAAPSPPTASLACRSPPKVPNFAIDK